MTSTGSDPLDQVDPAILAQVNARTRIEYARVVAEARDWWEAERARARQNSPTRIPDGAGTFMPWPPDRLARYVQYLAAGGRPPGTIRKAKSAILWWHRAHGQPVPDGRPASVVLSEHDTTLRASGWAPKRADPVTLVDMVRILATTDRGTAQGRRDACLLLLAYEGALTSGRLRALRVRDVTDHGGGLLIRGEDGEADLTLPHWATLGQHRPALCVVETTLAYARHLLDRGAAPDSRLIRPIDHYDHIAGVDTARAGDQPTADMMTARGLWFALAGLMRRAGVEHPERYTLTAIRLGGLARRRADGADLDQLAAAAGVTPRSSTLLDLVRVAETWAPPSTLPDGVRPFDPTGGTG